MVLQFCIVFIFWHFWTNNRHVCINLNAFLMVIQNVDMKLKNVDIFYNLCYIF